MSYVKEQIAPAAAGCMVKNICQYKVICHAGSLASTVVHPPHIQSYGVREKYQ